MTLHLPVWSELVDRPVQWDVEETSTLCDGAVLSMVRETVRTPDGSTMIRDVVEHPGAVAILAIDDDDHAVVLRQYRHPVAHELIEIPAGLLDVAGEDPWAAAQRELAEEAELHADTWHVLADIATSPGGNRETVRIYAAQGLRVTALPDGFAREGEEAHMTIGRAPLTHLRDAIVAGHVTNPALTVAVLTWFAVDGDVQRLRRPDAPWPMRAAMPRR